MPESDPSLRQRASETVQRVGDAASAVGKKVAETSDAVIPETIQRAARATQEAVRDAAGTLTGKNIEDKLNEYSELYTQVLLGLHKDVRLQREEIATLRMSLKAMQDSSTRSMVLLRRLTLAALGGVLFLALGALVWIAR